MTKLVVEWFIQKVNECQTRNVDEWQNRELRKWKWKNRLV